MDWQDTIIAPSTPMNWSGRIIVRMSGPEAHRIARSIVSDFPDVGFAGFAQLNIGSQSFAGWTYRFDAPRSYTGQDMIEFHIPGNPLLANRLIWHCIASGARHADPGEFTARAYFNGKLDLTQAEGVAATIAASNEQELSAARQLLAGELARRLRPAMDLLIDTLSLLEAGIDFVDEPITLIQNDELTERIGQIDQLLHQLLEDSARFEPLNAQPTIVLIGRPNAGKSTLLNALAGMQRAIVSPTAGTTRDAVSAEISLEHGMATLIDVAGIDESTGKDPISQQMRQRALRMAESADVVVSVIDSADASPRVATDRPPHLSVRTKIDLPGHRRHGELGISAISGDGMASLRHSLDKLCFNHGNGGAVLALNHRHVQAIQSARDSLARTQSAATALGHELIAIDLREALSALGTILGEVSPDDLLGQIFSKFCIGK